MDIYKDAKQLKKIPLLSGSDPAQLKLLAFTSEALSFSAGEYLFRINDVSDSVYVILKGEVNIIRDENPDTPIVLATMGKNNMLGEMGVFLNLRRNATVMAKTEVLALKIPAKRFLKLVTENPQAALVVMRDLSQKINFTSNMAINSQHELHALQENQD